LLSVRPISCASGAMTDGPALCPFGTSW
jgi:hypothetical protein